MPRTSNMTLAECRSRLAVINDFLSKPDPPKPSGRWDRKAVAIIRRVTEMLTIERSELELRLANARPKMKPANGWRVLVLSGRIWKRAHLPKTVPPLLAFVHFMSAVERMQNGTYDVFRVRLVTPCGTVAAEERRKGKPNDQPVS